ncbi:DMT family transporter [Neisseria meningitidis]|uniref:DMT family transporter n=1 Tax=Neisseria meningitidis TaxID=487 RepID=UPI000FCB0785|nr:DMT family transporter [Neisseria meningitidis]MBW3897319.1 DMT family transporter [Neisseria meningitidis]MBW3899059.1 DMT family transporter [Neisseria meningitidis]MBW3905158.1 DMT family transporter [Neisseria meningitidis]MBW3911287.1 DMT family transporter [Neisseria meningitidis]
MAYLLISIVFSVSVSILLKMARKKKIDIAQAVAVNYVVAVILTLLVLKPDVGNIGAFLPTWWLFAALGVLLPSVFVIMGKSVEAAGIVKSDAAQRLSLFLPIVAALTLFGEKLSEGRLIGLCLAFAALFCLLWKHSGGKKSGSAWRQAALLLGVWAGYGIIDILFKQLAKSGTAFAGNLLVAFVLAGVLMFACLFAKSVRWRVESVVGGIFLGGLNFMNIVTYITAHQMMKDNPTLVFAGMNIGVIVLGTLSGALFFKEKINTINTAGIVLALCSIACLFYWGEVKVLFGI